MKTTFYIFINRRRVSFLCVHAYNVCEEMLRLQQSLALTSHITGLIVTARVALQYAHHRTNITVVASIHNKNNHHKTTAKNDYWHAESSA